MSQSKGIKYIQSVQRAIDIINCFDETKIELSLSQISATLDLNKSTVHGIINTLHNNGFIQQNRDGKYLLGPELLNKSRFEKSSTRSLMLSTAKLYMDTIANKFKLTTNLFTIELDREPSFIHQEIPANAVYAISHISDTALPHTTASGKIYLAYSTAALVDAYIINSGLEKSSAFTISNSQALKSEIEFIKQNGYSYEKEELSEGVSAISAPIFYDDKRVVGTISVTGIAYYIEKNKTAIIADLKKASKDISFAAFKI